MTINYKELAFLNPAFYIQEPDEPVFIPAQGFERFSSKSGILLEVLFDPPRKLTHEQATRLSLKDHARIWKVRYSLHAQKYSRMPDVLQ